MKIRKMRATFGKLQNETLSFHDGLNVIFAPNESGKSTWCAFISAMLYGIDSSVLPETATAPWGIKALRRKTSLETPVRSSPQFVPVMPATGLPVPV